MAFTTLTFKEEETPEANLDSIKATTDDQTPKSVSVDITNSSSTSSDDHTKKKHRLSNLDNMNNGLEDQDQGTQPKKPRLDGVLGFVMPLRSYQPPSAELAVHPQHGTQLAPLEVARGCKQFWKAGDYEGCTHENSASSSVGMDHVRVHPKFLHSNATSHKWALGAFAELLDNSVDEICHGATYVYIDMLKNEKDGSKMLLVEDNGGGMTPDKMRQCMSLGYSSKSKLANTIGQYGNGFKTSTMRLGADVIVFSHFPGNNERRPTQSIGMLSYTFLRGTGKEDIVVPIIDYEARDGDWKKLIRTSEYDWHKNLATIVQWSPYLSEEDLLQQFNSRIQARGTRVIIFNLWEDDEGQLELDFDADPHDIQIRGDDRDEKKINMARQYPNSRHFLTYRHSLRSYASILYLNLPCEFKIFLRGKQVEHHDIENDMMLIKKIPYKPQIQEGIPRDSNNAIATTVKIGFVRDACAHIDVQGFNVYHKNRLIKPFWRVWNAAGSDGRGVIGVLEANFVEPAHDKQGFERTVILSRLQSKLLVLQKNYWTSNCQEVGYAPRRRDMNPNIQSFASDKPKTKKANQNSHDSARSPVNARRNASEERPHEKTRSSQAEVSPSSGDRQPFADSGEKNQIVNDLNCERERRQCLEIKNLEAEEKLQALDREQMALLDLLAERQEEGERLKRLLTEANQTINDLSEKVRELESRNGCCCKAEK